MFFLGKEINDRFRIFTVYPRRTDTFVSYYGGDILIYIGYYEKS